MRESTRLYIGTVDGIRTLDVGGALAVGREVIKYCRRYLRSPQSLPDI